MPKKSPLAPEKFPHMLAVAGVEMATANAGIAYGNRHDITLFRLARGTTLAGVFTQSSLRAAPILWCADKIEKGRARGLLINTGNANAFTGKAGLRAVRDCVSKSANLLHCPQNEIYVASTGVIGEPLPTKQILKSLPALEEGLKSGPWRQAANAIRTTDTFPKAATRVAKIDGEMVVINGIAKGSGMIAPNMATMLGFLFTNAKLPASVLQALLNQSNAVSFNAITVDSDTSTNDMVLAFATGEGAKHGPITHAGDPRLKDFRAKFTEICKDLAQQIVRDGEGASKFIEIRVTGAKSRKSARKIAMSVANSPLVKTAIAGEDANWGRFVMAVGKSGEEVQADDLEIRFGGQLVTAMGARHPDYDESLADRHLKQMEIDVELNVGSGRGTATVWTSDLTHGYIDINADYRS